MLCKFSLRSHKAPLTCLTSYNDALVSADRDGWVILWSISTRRPKALWKAHDGHILTLKSTPYGLMSHARDSFIRFWDLSTTSVEKCSSDPSKLATNLPKPHHIEIPVNALNFCNVDFCNGLLITPATVNSDNFDVYKLDNPFGAFSLRRILENIPPLSASMDKNQNKILEKADNPQSSDKRDGHGIIMRLLFINESLVFAGYESGAVFGYQLSHQNHDTVNQRGNERTVLFKQSQCSVVFSSMFHKPSPVLSIAYDGESKTLYTGSASKKLGIYNIEKLLEFDSAYMLQQDPKFQNLRHYGIQCLDLTEKGFLVGFWDGVVKGYDKNWHEVFRLERSEEVLRPDSNDQLSKTLKKSLCLAAWSPPVSKVTTNRKDMIRRKSMGTELCLFVGYGDGLISAFQ